MRLLDASYRRGNRRVARARVRVDSIHNCARKPGLPALRFFMPISGKPEIGEPKGRPGFSLRGTGEADEPCSGRSQKAAVWRPARERHCRLLLICNGRSEAAMRLVNDSRQFTLLSGGEERAGFAREILEWRMFLSANRFPPRIK